MMRRGLRRTSILIPPALVTGRRAFGRRNRFQPTWESLDPRPSPSWYAAANLRPPDPGEIKMIRV